MAIPARRTTRRVALVLLAAAVTAAGCSWIAVVPPRRSDNTRRRVRCTSSYAPPVIDVALASTGVVYGVYVLGSDDSENKTLKLMSMGVSILMYGLSASYGFKTIDECKGLERFENENP